MPSERDKVSQPMDSFEAWKAHRNDPPGIGRRLWVLCVGILITLLVIYVSAIFAGAVSIVIWPETAT